MKQERNTMVVPDRGHRPLRVLIVEDNPGDARLIREYLAETPGLLDDAVEARTLRDALTQIQESFFDLVLLDLNLPDSHGLSALRDAIAAAPQTAIVVLTGHEDSEVGLQAMRLGAQDFLSKNNIDAPLLARSIRYAIERERAQAADHFMAEAGRILASSIDYEVTLRSVCELVVRWLADLCVIDVVEPDDRLRRLDVACRDPARSHLAQALRELPAGGAEEKHLVLEVVRRSEAILITDLEPDLIERVTGNPRERKILEELRPVSFVAVPLVAHDTIVGTLTLASTTRRFDADDLALAQRLAWVAALEIENARLYRDVREALRARDRVLGVVAHDLRNPLSTIAMSVELMLDPLLTPEQQARQLHVIRRSAERMDRLIQDLLDVARIESDRLNLNREHQNPALLVREAVELNSSLAARKNLDLTATVDLNGSAVVVADHDRIIQVFSNLIGNAIKFTPEGGTVRVLVETGEEEVLFTVSDTGPGIEPDNLPLIFQPFWQSRRGVLDGAGLGLAIARGIVEAHGGRIWAESTLGVGTSFYFSLPRAEERRRSA